MGTNVNVPGGLPEPRPDQMFQGRSRAGTGPAPSNVIVARVVIIVGQGGELLVYNPTAAAGNLADSIAGMAGTDQFGNVIDQGITTYNPATALQPGVTVNLNNGLITFGDPLGVDPATFQATMGRFHVATAGATPITFINGATDDAATTNPAIWLFGLPAGASGRAGIAAFAGGSGTQAINFNVIDTLTFGSLVGGIPNILGPSLNRGSATTMVVATGNSPATTTTLLEIHGDADVSTAGNGLRVAEGSNAKQGTATLTGGTVVVANTSVTANSRIFLTAQTTGAGPGALRVSARTAGTSFTITSSNAADTSLVAYEIFEPG